MSDKRNTRRISFARAVEATADGVAPSACRLWRAGLNTTDKGDLHFTPRSAKAVVAAYEKRGNPLVFYYEHEDRIPLDKRGGAPMKGACSAPSAILSIRDGEGGPECWAEAIDWTAEARRQIETGERRQISPIAAFDEETREILEILNVSLCAEGATHSGTLLASRGNNMDELIQKILAAIEAGDWEAAESLIQEAEAAEGGAAMAKMARAAMKAAKDDAEPEAPKDDVATKKLAAALAATRTSATAIQAEFSRAVATERQSLLAATRAAEQATKEAKRTNVRVLIAASRELFDAADEREHLSAADPAATERYIESMRRKAKAGTIVLSREGTNTTDVKPPKDAPKDDPAKDLTVGDKMAIEAFNRGKPADKQITPADYLRSKTALFGDGKAN